MNSTFIYYIKNEHHYTEIIKRSLQVKRQLWIGTADIKDLYISNANNKNTIPYLLGLNELIRKKIEIRLIHAKEPGINFRNDFDKYPELWKGLERVLCPRVHFKIIIFDMNTAYIGSANLTGSGLGMKSKDNRNFEAGILTNIPDIVDNVIEHFDEVWIGNKCKNCKRKDFCGDKISV